MKLFTIEAGGRERGAVLAGDGRLYPLSAAGCPHEGLLSLIENAEPQILQRLRALANSPGDPLLLSFSPDEVRLCAPLPRLKQDVICLGVNYRDHIEETADVEDFQAQEATVYFSKRAARISGPGDLIPSYDFVDSLDYEAELGVILGRDVRGAQARDALKCVFGYTVINDVTARNVQFRHRQWYLGKSLDGYTIMGPCIVTADEIPDPQALDISCRVNGEERQRSNTRYMIQSVSGAIAELSAGMTLEAGTVIATGTPGGVGLGMKPPRYLRSGDTVVCRIEKIGELKNRVE